MPPRLAHERTAAICTIVIAAHLAQPHRGSQPTLVMDMGSPALKVRAAYSYRDDTAVPRFDDSSPIVFMDGQCALCTRAARLICKFDRRNVFKISPTASDLGRAILAHYRRGKPTVPWRRSFASARASVAAGEASRCFGCCPLVRGTGFIAGSQPIATGCSAEPICALRPTQNCGGASCYEGLHCWRLWRFR